MRRLVMAALAALLVPLVGCAEDEPKAEPSPEPSVTETKPAVPEDETAEEFIRRWFGTQQGLYDTGDATEYLSMTMGCLDCDNSARRITEIYSRGGSVDYDGGEITAVRPAPEADSTYLADHTFGDTAYTERAGGETKHLSGGEETYRVTLERDGSTWRVTDLMREVS